LKKYEVTYLTVAEENHNAGTVASILADNGAKIESVHLWGGRRKLAYPIKKQDQAFYTTVVFEAEPSAVQPIERALSLNDDVLRSLVVLYTPGFFERAAAGEDMPAPLKERETKSAPAEEVKTEAAVEETPVTEATEAPAEVAEATEPTEEKVEEAPVAEEKPKRTRAKKATAEDAKVLDEKIDELLNEDITK
jgi:small subunit ribosomal protein S6